MKIPFNKPYMTGRELEYIRQAHEAGHLAGDGEFTRRCQAWLEETVGGLEEMGRLGYSHGASRLSSLTDFPGPNG